MLHTRKLVPYVLFVLASAHCFGVDITRRGVNNPQVYGIVFPGDARAYYGAEAAIQSISMQEYVTSSFRVTEINIVTQGTALLRIYHSRPLRPGELQEAMSNAAGAAGVPAAGSIIQRPLPPQVQQMADRAAGIVEESTGTNVFKEYPIATHAHTMEFRIGTRSELVDLHDELVKHWLKEPAFFEGGKIVQEGEATSQEMKPRTLGGTLFKVQS